MIETIGRVDELFIAGDRGEPMTEVESALAIVGRGFEGDRYATGKGIASGKRKIDGQVTLIAREAVERANEMDYCPGYTPAETRRNIVTSDIDDLDHFREARLIVGEAAIRCFELCTPCGRPGNLVGKPGFANFFHGRGGLRAAIISGGQITVGDEIILMTEL